jgi:hypothetical protein
MNKILIIILTFVFVTDIFASPNYKGMSQAYKDGYEYSKEHGSEIGRGLFVRTAFKSTLYRLIPSCLWVSYASTLPSHGAVDMFTAMLVIPYNLGIIIYDFMVLHTEFLINRDENLRRNAFKYLEKEGKDIKYRQEFLDGIERFIKDKDRR